MPENQQLEGGAYEVIRARLEKQGTALRERLARLNADRNAVFGAVEMQLVATERVTTSNNCTPRDMFPIGGGRFLFGYNVQLGLRSTTELNDVFAAYAHDRETHAMAEIPLSEVIKGADFEADFKYIYKYYKEAVFVKFRVSGPHLYMAFRIGREIDDIKAFKFRMEEGRIVYLGNRFDHEYAFPPQQEFEWKRAHRDMHREGEHPHVSIEDRVFVETTGGDLTIKIEDNTSTGQ
ncbi:MAG: DNA repair ATPase, partial [Verrucomicrobiota bacterium]